MENCTNIIVPAEQSIFARLGEPTRTITESHGVLEIWNHNPIIVTRIRGLGSSGFAREIDCLYRMICSYNPIVVTVHEWSEMTEHDTEARKVLQRLNQAVQQQQREMVIHLGKSPSFAKQVVRTTVETIIRFRKQKIELPGTTEEFEQRVHELIDKYRSDL